MKKNMILVLVLITVIFTLCACGKKQKPGLYVENKLSKSWQELLDEGILTVTDGELASGFYESAEDGIGNVSDSDLCGKLIIDDSVTSIAYSGLRFCSGLNEVVLPDNLKSIDRYAFQLSGIIEMHIPKSLESFGNFCIEGCTNLRQISVDKKNPVYTSIDGALFTKDKKSLVQYPIGAETNEYTIPKGITDIQTGAFGRCLNIKVINIPASVKEIGTAAFWGCQNLETIHFNGTEEEWNAIPKGEEWMEYCNAQITFK